MNRIFAIDLGSNSIGWALRNTNLKENQIEKVGVLTFNKGVGLGKAGEYSYAAERTKKRSMRRLYQSRKYRLWATLENLIGEGYCPLSIEDLNKWRYYNKEEAIKNNNGGRLYPVYNIAFDAWIKLDFNNDGKPEYSSPYQLRKELAEKKLDFSKIENKFKLGRALYHIAQRRGFKSSRKSAGYINENEIETGEIVDLQYSEKKKNIIIDELYKKYPEAKTIGHLCALLENDNFRIRENIAQYAIRENYKEEIKHIFQFQQLGLDHKIYQLTSVIYKDNKGKICIGGSIFYKRPLRSQKGLIGKCTLEPNKKRVPISHPTFEIYRAWAFLNNIKYKQSSNKDEEWDHLPLDLKQSIYIEKFFRKSKPYFSFSEIEEFIKKKGYNWVLNYKPKTTVTGCPVSARLMEIFGADFLQLKIAKEKAPKSAKSFYDIDDIWHVLFNYEDQEFVSEFASEKLKLDELKTKQFVAAWNTLPSGYGMLSLHAIKKINNFLEKGFIYTEAVLLANIPKIIGSDLWNKNKQLLLGNISNLIEQNRRQKAILNIVNNLVSTHKNLSQKFGFKDSSYILDDSDKKDIKQAIEENFGRKKWEEKNVIEREEITNIVTDCYQAYFKTSGLTRKDIKGERHFEIKSGKNFYYKSDSGYYRLPKLVDTLSEFLQLNFEVSDRHLKYIYHPSEINIYPPAKPDKDGIIKLGSPKTGSFKNPMAMRALHELRKLINYMIETNQIDCDTRVVVEVARELNDANKRWAIEAWQRQREAENREFSLAIEQLLKEKNELKADATSSTDIDKMRLFYEQNDEQNIPPLMLDEENTGKKKEKEGAIRWIGHGKKLIDKYRLWVEQGYQCIYTGKFIKLTDLFDENIIDFEHTIPRSKSFDNSLANLTVCFHDFNRTVKKNQIPTQLNNYNKDFGGYSAIFPRLEKWKEKIERIYQQIDFWKTKSKKAIEKHWKDDAIRQKHLWQMELDYWKNKVDRFTIEEITSGFRNSQLVDTQLITKYAFHYLKTYFEKVDVQKGSITAEFRKIFGIEGHAEKKDRNKHSHHAKDAAILTLIPHAAKRDEILKLYYEHQEKKIKFKVEPYKGFKRESIWSLDDTVLINNISNTQILTPAKRAVRKRGKLQFIEGTNKPMWATGDCIRGQLHQETLYGAIKPAKRNKKGILQQDEEGKYILEEKEKYVIRVPFQYKKDSNTPGFNTIEEIEEQIVDYGLKAQIRKQVEKSSSLKEAFEKGIHLLDKNGEHHGNKIRHIRVWANVAEPLRIKKHTNISKADYKQHYYAGNSANSYFAIYACDKKKYFDFRNLLETAQALSTNNIKNPIQLFEPSIIIKKGKMEIILPLKYILENGKKIIFTKDDEDVKSLSNNKLLKRLYVFTNFEKDGRLNLKYHLEARSKIDEKYSKSELDFDKPKPTLRFGYAKYDFVVEGYDFLINIDGTIKWK